MYMYHVCIGYLKRLEEGAGVSGTGAIDDCESLSGRWERKAGPL